MFNSSTVLVYAFAIFTILSFTFKHMDLGFASGENNTSKNIENSFETKLNDMNSTDIDKEDLPIVECPAGDKAAIWCSNIH